MRQMRHRKSIQSKEEELTIPILRKINSAPPDGTFDSVEARSRQEVGPRRRCREGKDLSAGYPVGAYPPIHPFQGPRQEVSLD